MKICPQCQSGHPDHCVTCPTHGAPLTQPRDLPEGLLIRNAYRIVRKLGEGGMGSVYLARQTLMDELVALKFLSSELGRDASFTNRFLREAKTLHSLRHPNIVDAGYLEQAEDESFFFTMEYVDGPDLAGLIREQAPMVVDEALSIARGVAAGLAAAHAKGLVHRDVKPQNILMAREGGRWLPKIADFGLVATKESSQLYTRTRGTLLTMAYAAPEQWDGMRAHLMDGRTDLYALGGVLYELLTGRTPFLGEYYEEWSRLHRTEPPQPPSAFRPELKEWPGLDALLLSLLAKDRARRPSDAGVVADALAQIAARHAGAPEEAPTVVRAEADRRALPASPQPKPSSAPQPASQPAPAPALRQSSSPGRSRALRWGFGLAAVAALVVVVVLLRMHGGATSSKASSDVSAQYAQGEAAFRSKDYAAARARFRQACDGGEMKGCNYLGYLYAQGMGGDKDPATARAVYEKACEGGVMSGCASLGSIYEDAGDHLSSYAYFKKACEGGLSDGCQILLEQGETAFKARDYAGARDDFGVACQGGEMKSCNYMGYLYAQGLGGDRDAAAAKGVYAKACGGGQPAGCASLGALYQDAGDKSSARTYFQKACAGGLADGCQMLKALP